MLRHRPVLAKETYENLPHPLKLSFDGTFWHGGHVEYFFTHLAEDNLDEYKNLKIVACDVDEKVMNKLESIFLNMINDIVNNDNIHETKGSTSAIVTFNQELLLTHYDLLIDSLFMTLGFACGWYGYAYFHKKWTKNK